MKLTKKLLEQSGACSEGMRKDTHLSITTKISSSEIAGTRLISISAYADYHYVEATISANINIDDKNYNITLQTGLGYEHNDYNCPSNNLEINTERYRTDSLIYKIHRISEDEFDDETVTEINEFCETSYTIEQMLEIRNSIAALISNAQAIIDEAECEAELKLDTDENIYVLYYPREKVEEEPYHWIQAGPDELKIFDNKDDANEFIENVKDCEIAYIIGKEVAYSQFSEDF